MPLTWRNVNAPNFSGANQSAGMANQLLLSALSSGSNTLRRADDRNRDRVNSQAMLQLAGLSDAEGAEAQVQDILAGIAPGRLNASTLQFGANRPDALIRRELTENQVRDSDFAYEGAVQRREQSDAFNAAAPTIEAYRTAKRNGNAEEANRILSENPDIFKGLSGDDTLRIGQGNFQAGMDFFNRGNAKLNLERGNYGFGRQQRNDGITDEVAQVVSKLSGSLDSGTARRELRRMLTDKEISPEVFNASMGRVDSLGLVSGASPFLGGGLTGGTAGASAERVMNYEARALGFKAVPDSVKTLGQASEFAKQVNRAGAKSSAMGVYQIVGSTMRAYAPKVFGKDWESQDYNFEAQDKLGKAIFEDNKGSADALRKQWVSLSKAEAEQLRKLPWEEARQVIARKESNGDPAALSSREAGATQTQSGVQIATAASQANSRAPVYDAYYGNAEDRTPQAQAISQAMSDPESLFYGADPELLTDRVQQVQKMARRIKLPDGSPLGLNVKQALGIMAENGQPTGGPESFLTDWARWDDLGNGNDIDYDRINSSLKSIASGEGEGAYIRGQSIDAAKGELDQANSVLEAAKARYTQGLSRGLTESQMAPLIADLRMAEQLFRGINSRVQSGGDSLSLTGNRGKAGNDKEVERLLNDLNNMDLRRF